MCGRVIEILLQQVDASNRWLMDAYDQTLKSYQLEENHDKYLFLVPKTQMNSSWINNAHIKNSITKVLNGWMALNKAFYMLTQDVYKASIFHKPIQVLNTLLCILYGERDSTILRSSWVPIMLEIIKKDKYSIGVI